MAALCSGGLIVVGTVKWFNAKKGFGFILNPHGQDVFVHFSSIVAQGFRSLKQGQKVQFLQVDGPKGPAAEQVQRLPNSTPPASPANPTPKSAVKKRSTPTPAPSKPSLMPQ